MDHSLRAFRLFLFLSCLSLLVTAPGFSQSKKPAAAVFPISLDADKAGPEKDAIVVSTKAIDTSVLPPNLVDYETYRPLPFEETIKFDPALGQVVLCSRYGTAVYNIDKVYPAIKRSAPMNIPTKASVRDGSERYYAQYHADFVSLVSTFKRLDLIVTYREPDDPSVYEYGRTAVKGTYYPMPKKERPAGIVVEAICLDPPMSIQVIRGRLVDKYWTVTSECGFYTYEQKTVIRLGSSAEAVVATVKPEYLYIGGVSIVDGRDRDGYDSRGFDREGYDRLGWNAEGASRTGDRWTGRIGGGKQGWGALVRMDGSRLIGYFLDDKPLGICAAIGPAGERSVQAWTDAGMTFSRPVAAEIAATDVQWVYLGTESRASLAEGQGDAISLDGKYRVESGTYAKGRLVSGSMISNDGTTFSGNFAADRIVAGIIIGADGSRYTGPYVNGVPAGKGSIAMADGTRYEGDFLDGQYEGQGVISKPNGEGYEGSFRKGLPHGMGIYVNGGVAERCEYYNGQRIDQAWQIRQENAKNLEALRMERERIAREKADQVEQNKVAAERSRAAEDAKKEKSSNNFLSSIVAAGTVLAVGGSMHMDTKQVLSLAGAAAIDAGRGDSSMSTMKATGQAMLGSGSASGGSSGGGAPSGGGVSGPKAIAKSNLLNSYPGLKKPAFDRLKDDDFQLYSQCATAQMYYEEYLVKVEGGRPQAECEKIYEMHGIAANNAIAMYRSVEKAQAEKKARQGASAPAR